jgi:phosphoribosylglycinamide formyltransferase-1
MRIGLITYQRGHLKTEQVARGLAALNRHRLEFYGLPFAQRPARIPRFDHRPDQFADRTPPEILAKDVDGSFRACASQRDIEPGPDIWMVMVGVLLSAEFLSQAKVINCHAGIVPAVRGLDSFKWAILDGQPLGVTLHYVDAEVDAGEIVAVVPTRVREDDTIADLAQRHYENEVETLIAFERHLIQRENSYAALPKREPRLRMNNGLEVEMLKRFPAYRDKWATRVVVSNEPIG